MRGPAIAVIACVLALSLGLPLAARIQRQVHPDGTVEYSNPAAPERAGAAIDVSSRFDELIERTEMELDYRLEADNQRAFAKAYEGHPRFAIPHVVASAPKAIVQEWIDGVPMAEIIRHGTPDQRDLIGTRLLELTFDAPRRLGMLHGDAHPGNFMLLPDDRMGVLDFGAVAPLPGGYPVELGMTIRLARDKNYDLLLPTMEKVGFIQKGQQVSVRDVDEILRQYIEPVQVDVFHYTRKWLQKMTYSQIDRSVSQIRTARQMDLPPKLAIPMRVIASVTAILCQLDAHVPIKSLSEELIPGFADPDTAVV